MMKDNVSWIQVKNLQMLWWVYFYLYFIGIICFSMFTQIWDQAKKHSYKRLYVGSYVLSKLYVGSYEFVYELPSLYVSSYVLPNLYMCLNVIPDLYVCSYVFMIVFFCNTYIEWEDGVVV